jgi:hypothetical protein
MSNFFHTSHRKQEKEQGYILLLALLVTSIILAVGFGIYNITLREVVLSTFLRDSAKALTAADRGVECALYWDRSSGIPPNTLPYTIFATGTIPTYYSYPDLTGVRCNSVNITSTWTHTETAQNGRTEFSLAFGDGTCVDVVVIKTGDQSTAIIGSGYNTCDPDARRRTQREIAVFTTF